MFGIPVYAASSDYTVTVSTDAKSVKQGDVLTVNVVVSGAHFCAADAQLSYDKDSYDCVSTMSGWSNDGKGQLRYVNVKGSDGYWEDGKVIGKLKFVVKENAPAGKTTFDIGKKRDVFIVGDWSEGASSEKSKPLKSSQLVSATVNVVSEKGDSEPLKDFGVISDDGNTVNMKAGYHIYSIPDTDNEKVKWKSSDESIVTVDENGLVTAVSDGTAVLTALDEDGNEVELRTINVGDMSDTQTDGTAVSDENKDSDSMVVITAVAAVLFAALVIVVIVIMSRKRKSKE